MAISSTNSPRIVIAGAGLSGMCLAMQLKRKGFSNFTVLEKSGEVGGTWLENHYPNAGCDIPSFLYCYSFAPKYDWSEKYARQPEILEYLRDCAERFGVRPHVEFNTAIRSASYDETTCQWQIATQDGRRLEADILVSAVGQLNRPRVPNLSGLESFQGAQWHSARWNHDFDLRGKRVAVVGNGASAVQFVPRVVELADKVFLFQRTPCWVHPQHNYRYPRWAHRLFRLLPPTAALHRFWLFLASEWRFLAFRKDGAINSSFQSWLRHQMKKAMPLPLWDRLIPKYPPGCKRVVLSSDYLQAVARPNVELIVEPIESVDAGGIATASDRHEVDAIIFGTGFDTSEFLHPMKIYGRTGQLLSDAWRQQPKTLLGMATPGFPNLFFLYGPNTNLGHNSILYMVECQVNYLLRCLKHMRKRGWREIEADAKVVDRFQTELHRRLGQTVWAGDCSSWYKTATGTIPNNWSGTATSYWLHTRRPNFSHFRGRGRNGQ